MGAALNSVFQRLSVRNKLLALVLLPLVLVLPLLGLVLLLWSNEAFDRLLITKVRSDLAVAHGYFERVRAQVGAGTAAVAESNSLHRTLAAGQPMELTALLQQQRERNQLDFVTLCRPDGTPIARDSGALEATPPRWPELAFGVHVHVLQASELAVLPAALRARVDVPLLSTRNAAPSERRSEDRALLLLAQHAVRDERGQVIALVRGGVLLNRNLDFIDQVNTIVYPENALPFGSRGTATLFLDDVRISTNVRLFGESAERAIGTRVSAAVREGVLGQGQTWLGRAFVVNDWYVSGYEPLLDGAGRRVGMLYVGFTEAPFRWLKWGMLAALGAVCALVMLGAAVFSLRWARAIFAPLERMAQTMQAVQRGAMASRVGAVASADEIGQLAGHLDHLLDTVDEKTRALQAANADLDAKVAARTAELQAAQTQLVRSEKLATVGQLTASIAHEVNNPIAVIQGNLDLVRELLGAEAERVKSELRLADEQLERMRLIVTQLLQFARPTEFAGYVETVDINRLAADSLLLAEHLLVKTQIVVRRELQARACPQVNRNELQQVLVNLIVNAIHAMTDGGELTIRTLDEGTAVRVDVIDTGPGLDDELLRALFQPFVTRKKDGTGLGLWISRTIVERYGGEIVAGNRGNAVRGARFTVRLPLETAP